MYFSNAIGYLMAMINLRGNRLSFLTGALSVRVFVLGSCKFLFAGNVVT